MLTFKKPFEEGVINIEENLRQWTLEQLQLQGSLKEHDTQYHWEPLPGDAGFRQYFRIRLAPANLLVAYAPPDVLDNHAFLKVGEFFFQHGIHVPKVLAYDLGRGYFLVEDLGETLLLDHLDEDSVNTLYGEALLTLLRIQQCPIDHSIFPRYNRERLLEELKLFSRWFVREMLGYELDDEERLIMSEAFETLLMRADEQPQVLVHRDYHSRNLVYSPNGSPGVIDFQDAVIGPFTYDLVSLLRDCYAQWPEEQVRRWALAYGNMAVDAGVIPSISEQQLLHWFDLMGMQRHIKVLGIFVRLSVRDGKHRYLNDLPLVLQYFRSVGSRYDELGEFMAWFEERLMPLVAQQPWYRSNER